MTPPTLTIDLGEVRRGGAAEAAPAWPAWQRLRRWVPRPWRLASATAAAVLAMATLTAASPAESPLQLRFTVPAENFMVDGQHLYVIDEPEPGPVWRLTAYRLEDGGLVWRTTITGGDGGFAHFLNSPESDQSPLLVAAYPGGPEAVTWQVSTITGLDPGTGETLWTADGLPGTIRADLALLTQDPSGLVLGEATAPRQEVVAVDLTTGDELWQGPVQGSSLLTTEEAPHRLVSAGPRGELTTYDLRTGEQLATAQPAIETIGSVHLQNLVGSIVLLGHGQLGGQEVLSAYDVESLDRLWTVDADTGAGVWPTQCGDLICLNTPGSSLLAVDPATGERVWSADWLPTGAGQPTGYVISGHPVAGHLLVNSSLDGRDSQWLVDVDTGEPALELSGWRLTLGPAGEAETWALWPATADRPAWAGRLRPDLSGIEPIGEIDRAGYCVSRESYLVCSPQTDHTGNYELAVWQVSALRPATVDG